ncbi:MAG: hypothetical protein E5Y16_36490 [Mesorhizobium sp.]|nr:MAG: hypothetical protein E5Y16_36490 [Mesorhizobium sp.]
MVSRSSSWASATPRACSRRRCSTRISSGCAGEGAARWRLPKTRGVGGTAPPSVLPDISPTRGEIGRHL